MSIGLAIVIAVVLYLMVNSIGFRKVVLVIAGLWTLAMVGGINGNQTLAMIALLPLLPFLH